MQIDASIVISIAALIIAIVTLYLQWFRVRGAIVSLLNDEKQEQRTILLPSYSRLPEIIRESFPEYKEKYPGYAEVRLNFANAGDRTGITEILKIEVKNPPTWSTIKASYYNYNLIPAYEMANQMIVLRNIPPIDNETVFDMIVRVAWGGANSRTGKYQKKGVIEQRVKILLVPSEVEPLSSKDLKT